VGDSESPPLDTADNGTPEAVEAKPSITDLLKNPSKVVLCKVIVKDFVVLIQTLCGLISYTLEHGWSRRG